MPAVLSKYLDHVDDQGEPFLRRCAFLLIATRGANGALEVSPRGDEPGFAQLEDARTLLLPERDGNNVAQTLVNILHDPEVGLIFLVPRTGETLRVSGRATIHDDAALCARLSAKGKPAKLVLRVGIRHAYFHCARALLRSRLWNPESWPAPGKVSFGRIIARARRAGQETEREIDTFAETLYRDGL
ncbi:pyridoxamine 5'-phosphate oxidase family protein [Leptolyngbya sp. 15MV]|nr:pyridoxamine 5'-phosphate oxidase family protein [Leptolyngbya sp. 15MV]